MDIVLDTCPVPECNLTPRDVAGLLNQLAAYHAHAVALIIPPYRGKGRKPSKLMLKTPSNAPYRVDELLDLPVRTLNLDPATITPDAIIQLVQRNTSPKQVNLLVIDQFEELFTQSEPAERDILFALLERLPPFTTLGAHIIATMRSDFLPELFARKALYDIAKQGIDLRQMSVGELKTAIQKPLSQRHPNAGKRFEDALLDRLASEAAKDASYLPLLQVTLRRLWDKGSLKLSAYGAEGTLADELREQADDVYAYIDHAGDKQQPRSETEQAAMMQIFLDLVNVSLDDDPRRDVRRRRAFEELADADQQRARLIEELVAARLLSRGVETRDNQQIETVDIIHEALIANWKRLQALIAEQRRMLQRQTRFKLALDEWEQCGRDAAYLLDGIRLAEAEELNAQRNIELRTPAAQDFLRYSLMHRATEQQRELELHRKLAEEERRRAEAERRHAEELQQALAEARERLALAESRRLTILSRDHQGSDPQIALLLAAEALSVHHNLDSDATLRAALAAAPLRIFQAGLFGHSDRMFSRDGRRILIAGGEDAGVWDVDDGALLVAMQPVTFHGRLPTEKVSFTLDDTAFLVDNRELYDVRSGQLLAEVSFDLRLKILTPLADRWCVRRGNSGQLEVWDWLDQAVIVVLEDDVTDPAWTALSADIATVVRWPQPLNAYPVI